MDIAPPSLSHSFPRDLPAKLVSVEACGRKTASACVAEECPVAFSYNGFPHAVMMASPTDLADFAFGFSLTEGIIESIDDIDAVEISGGDEASRIEVSLTGKCLKRYLAQRRVRRLSGNTSCGLCGVEDLADAAPRPLKVPAGAPLDPDVIAESAQAMRGRQPLSRLTRGAHAAAWVSVHGLIATVREDVGRHNALDKLIGTLLRQPSDGRDGFCLITSRCSFEMVQKAAAAGFSRLVSISSPTALAVRTAQAAGLTLYALSNGGTPLQFASQDMA